MAGKKSKGEAKGQSKRGAGPVQKSSVDDITRRLTGMQAQDELTLQQVQCQQHVAIISPFLDPCIHASLDKRAATEPDLSVLSRRQVTL